LAGVFVTSVTASASAQNAASNKGVFAYNPTGISVTPFFNQFELFNLSDAIKTSTNGSLLLGLSMESFALDIQQCHKQWGRRKEFVQRQGDR
jgi:hypothetical protein